MKINVNIQANRLTSKQYLRKSQSYLLITISNFDKTIIFQINVGIRNANQTKQENLIVNQIKMLS